MKQRWETNNVCKDGLKAEWLGMIVCTSNNEPFLPMVWIFVCVNGLKAQWSP